jgi:hypothetical protein
VSRLNLNDPGVWNKWRELYPVLTDEEQREFANECAASFGHQEHHNIKCFETLFTEFARPNCIVFEVGGWKGELAKKCLEKFEINAWVNMEFCQTAIEQTVSMPEGRGTYYPVQPDCFEWFKGEPNFFLAGAFDVFVSAHTIEHFSDEHLAQLLDFTKNIPIVMLEAPISNEGNSWNDYVGTHILKMGWNAINEIMKKNRYEPLQVTEHCWLYRRALDSKRS